MSASWKAVLGVVLIFIFGFFSGAICSSIYVHRKMADFLKHPAAVASAALEKKLTENLALDPAQKKQIDDYFLVNLEQRKEVQKQIQPQVQALNRETFTKIAAALRPDQAERFHQNLEEFHKRYAKYVVSVNVENTPANATGTITNPAAPPASK